MNKSLATYSIVVPFKRRRLIHIIATYCDLSHKKHIKSIKSHRLGTRLDWLARKLEQACRQHLQDKLEFAPDWPVRCELQVYHRFNISRSSTLLQNALMHVSQHVWMFVFVLSVFFCSVFVFFCFCIVSLVVVVCFSFVVSAFFVLASVFYCFSVSSSSSSSS